MRRPIVLLIGALTLAVVAVATVLFVADRGQGQEDKTLLEKTNDKLARVGQPTFASEAQLNPTPRPPRAPYTATPGPSPTPTVPTCAGGTITGAEEIVAQYGGTFGPRCASVGGYLYFATLGKDGQPGGIALYQCQAKCEAYADSGESGSWTFYQAPNPGRARVLAFVRPETLVLADRVRGQVCFNLRTREFITQLPCFVEPTIPPGSPGTSAEKTSVRN